MEVIFILNRVKSVKFSHCCFKILSEYYQFPISIRSLNSFILFIANLLQLLLLLAYHV